MEQAKNEIQRVSNLNEVLRNWQPMPSPSIAQSLTMPNIAALRKADKPATIEKVIILLTRYTQMLNIDRNMNSAQIQMCAEQIVEQQWMYSLEDIQTMLSTGVCGQYGEIYNRMDIAVIFGWIAKYEQERQAVVRLKKKEEMDRNNIYDVFHNDTMRDVLKDVVDKIKLREQEVVKASDDVKTDTRSPFEKMVMEEWDELPVIDVAGRIGVYKEQAYDFTAYRAKRYQEMLAEEPKTEGITE